MPGPFKIDAPGTSKFAPCEDLNCGHRDCEASLRDIKSLCTLCTNPIGYDTDFYYVHGKDKDGNPNLTHASCYWEENERPGDTEKPNTCRRCKTLCVNEFCVDCSGLPEVEEWIRMNRTPIHEDLGLDLNNLPDDETIEKMLGSETIGDKEG